MIPFLLALTEPDPAFLHQLDPKPSFAICFEMEHELFQGVEFNIITEEQANKLIERCLVNYSTGPNAPHILS